MADRILEKIVAEDIDGALDLLAILVFTYEPGTRACAGSEVETHARGALVRAEKISLFGEVHRHRQSTIPQTEKIVQSFHARAHSFCAGERPVVTNVSRCGSGTHEQFRSRSRADLDQNRASRAVHAHVEDRSVSLDPPQLLEVRRELRRYIGPVDVRSRVEYPGRFVFRKPRTEV